MRQPTTRHKAPPPKFVSFSDTTLFHGFVSLLWLFLLDEEFLSIYPVWNLCRYKRRTKTSSSFCFVLCQFSVLIFCILICNKVGSTWTSRFSSIVKHRRPYNASIIFHPPSDKSSRVSLKLTRFSQKSSTFSSKIVQSPNVHVQKVLHDYCSK